VSLPICGTEFTAQSELRKQNEHTDRLELMEIRFKERLQLVGTSVLYAVDILVTLIFDIRVLTELFSRGLSP